MHYFLNYVTNSSNVNNTRDQPLKPLLLFCGVRPYAMLQINYSACAGFLIVIGLIGVKVTSDGCV